MAKKRKTESARTSSRSTMSGPSAKKPGRTAADPATRKLLGTGELAGMRPFNQNKAGEYASTTPAEGEHYPAPTPEVTASTLTETNPSPKAGELDPLIGVNH